MIENQQAIRKLDNEILGLAAGYVAPYYQQWWRFYHNQDHVHRLLKGIHDNYTLELFLAIVFHDAIYDPRERDNEDKSKELYVKFSELYGYEVSQEVLDLIDATKLHFDTSTATENQLLIRKLDRELLHKGFAEQIKGENAIAKEFQFHPYDLYKKGRVEALRFLAEQEGINLSSMISYVENRRLKVGVYPGSFNPFHVGHLDILKKSLQIFDKVIVLVANNALKNDHIWPFPNLPVEVMYLSSDKLTSQFINELSDHENFESVSLIRGLRNGSDFEYESDLLQWMKDLSGSPLNAVYIPCDKDKEHISSSMIRGLTKIDPELAKKYIVK